MCHHDRSSEKTFSKAISWKCSWVFRKDIWKTTTAVSIEFSIAFCSTTYSLSDLQKAPHHHSLDSFVCAFCAHIFTTTSGFTLAFSSVVLTYLCPTTVFTSITSSTVLTNLTSTTVFTIVFSFVMLIHTVATTVFTSVFSSSMLTYLTSTTVVTLFCTLLCSHIPVPQSLHL